MKPLFRKALSFLMFLLLSTAAFAQGSLRGVITDSLTNKPLIGANAYLLGTSQGDATDLQGEYRIDRIPVGTYTLRVSYIGYMTKNLEVTIQSGVATTLDIALNEDFVQLGEIIVTAQALGQAAAINQQITSNTIVNVVSEEKIRELPDANAAESIGRLPGVSVLRSGGEANKVIVRGLEDKFTVITIDGVKIPPTDATSRGVDLSTFSQSSLAGIELYKAVTPDKDGDALAGSINLVTKKAPEIGKFKADLTGDYNHLMESADQYDFSFHYGGRFFDNFLGVQLAGNLEKRIRSNERIDVNYNQSIDGGADFFINDFLLEFTDEIRERDGVSVLLDIKTPDDGTIRFNNVFGRTKRDFLLSTRDYPVEGGGSQQGNPVYNYRDRKQEINTFSSSLRGDQHLLGMKLYWGASFGQSESDFPFDYEAIFVEPSGMQPPDGRIQSEPEQLISYAVNDFSNASMYWTYFRSQDNFDKERTAFLDAAREYLLSGSISGEIKIGGKYKSKDRSNARSEDFTPYYLGRWQPFEQLPDGTIRRKDFSGTYFEEWQDEGGLFVPIDQFFVNPGTRNVYDSYSLNPLIDRDRLRQWYELNKNGIDATGNQREVWVNPLIRFDDYSVTERVGAGYIMNTLDFGQKLTVIAGLRIENEDNDYVSTFMPRPVSGFPVPANSIRDTTSSASQTVLLPNLNVAYSPFDFMKLRVAAYKALARPDFNMRLDRYIAGRPAEVGTQFQVYVGNPNLRTARAWNYELNTSFYGNKIGLVSLSAYYKEIEDMYHMLNDFNTVGDSLLQNFDIQWASQMRTTPYDLTLPYNSPTPAKVWGFEFEHQVNFRFLPGLLKNLVLSYNASIVRSEAVIYGSRTITFIDSTGPFPLPKSRNILVERKRKLEGMPEFFGNIALGYDIGKFSGRVSLFHQGEHNVAYSATGLSDQVTNAYTRIDLALKQRITNNLALFLNLSNLTNVEDGNSIQNRVFDRSLFNQSEQYGLTADFGATIQLE